MISVVMAVLLACPTGGPIPRSEQPLKDPIPGSLVPAKFVLSVEKEQYLQLEPIIVKYRIENTSKNSNLAFYTNDAGFGFINVYVTLRQKEVPKTFHDSSSSNLSGKGFVLTPGGHFEGQFIANLFCDMTAEGEYTVKAEQTVNVNSGKAGSWQNVYSSGLTINVKGYPIKREELNFDESKKKRQDIIKQELNKKRQELKNKH